MTKFLTNTWRVTIEPVEVVRESDSFVWVEKDTWNLSGGTSKKARREKKHTEGEQYHDSWDDAKHFLVLRESSKIERLEKELHRAKTALGQVESLKAAAVTF